MSTIIDTMKIRLEMNQNSSIAYLGELFFKSCVFEIELGNSNEDILSTIARSVVISEFTNYIKVRPVRANNGAALIELQAPKFKIIALGLDIIAVIFDVKYNPKDKLRYEVLGSVNDTTNEVISCDDFIRVVSDRLELLNDMPEMLHYYPVNEQGWQDITELSTFGVPKLAYRTNDGTVHEMKIYNRKFDNKHYMLFDIHGDIKLDGNILDYIITNDSSENNSFMCLEHGNIFRYDTKIDNSTDYLHIKHDENDIYIDILHDNILDVFYKTYHCINMLNSIRKADIEDIGEYNLKTLIEVSTAGMYAIIIGNIEIIGNIHGIFCITMSAILDNKESSDHIFIQRKNEQEQCLSTILALLKVTYTNVLMEAEHNKININTNIISNSIKSKDKHIIKLYDSNSSLMCIQRKDNQATKTCLPEQQEIVDNTNEIVENTTATTPKTWQLTICTYNLFPLTEKQLRDYMKISISKRLERPSVIITIQ